MADRADAASIDMEGALAAGRGAYNELERFGTSALSWAAPCNTLEQAAKLRELCKAFCAALRRMGIARDACHLLKTSNKAKLAKTKKDGHEQQKIKLRSGW